MAMRFARVFLSEEPTDFEPMTLDLGVPLLDQGNASYRVIHRWLGRLTAEPERQEQSVAFFVCDDQGARLNGIECEPATVDDLRRNSDLKKDLQEIAARFESVQPQNAMEQKLLGILSQDFQQLVDAAGPAEKACHFFKYREGKTWRLVWCWGYSRTDQEPAHPTICTNPECKALFIRRSSGSRNCPYCAGVKQKKKSILPLAIAALLLLLLLGGGGAYYFSGAGKGDLPSGDGKGDEPIANTIKQPGFAATPESWLGPAGARINFKVIKTSEQGEEEDVTSRVVVVVEDPKIVRISNLSAGAEARSAGSTVVHFYLGNEETRATLTVAPPENPESLVLEPENATLGFGSTLAVRVMGRYREGEPVDLTGAVEWLPPEGRSVYFFNGLLEGVKPGMSKIHVRYRSSPNADYVTGSLQVNVLEEKYTALAIALDPQQFMAGASAGLQAIATTEGGEERSVLGSSQLEWSVAPSRLAEVEGEFLVAQRAGEGVLKATFQGLEATLALALAEDPEGSRFNVKPTALQLAVGEQTELEISTANDAPVRVESSNPSVAEVLSDHRIVGRSPGAAVLTVVQGKSQADVSVEVTAIAFKELAIDPGRISTPVDGVALLRVVAIKADGVAVAIAPDQLTWEQLPAASFAEIDLETLEVRGRQPTHDSPQPVTVRLGDLKAQGRIDVVPQPLEIELTPAGPVELAEGRKLLLQAWANYSDGRRVAISPAELQWDFSADNESGLDFEPSQGLVRATKAGDEKVLVKAKYQGGESNAVEISSVAASPVELVLTSDRKILLVDETGVLLVDLAQREEGDESELDGVVFSSSDENILTIDPATGAFRALAKGSVTVEAKHAAAQSPAQLELQVVASDEVELVLRPDEVQLHVGGQVEIELYLVAPGGEERISLQGGESGGVQIALENKEAVQWEPPLLAGVQQSEAFWMGARYHNLTATALVVVGGSDGALRVVPESAALAPGQPLTLRIERQVGDTDQWNEVDPALVDWTVPDALDWTAAAEGLRPRVSLLGALAEPAILQAEVGGASASMSVTFKSVDDVLDPSDPDVAIVIEREPAGDQLEEGRRQRYTVMLEKDGQREPAANFSFGSAFENDFVRWEPPVLYAKQRGSRQMLEVKVGEDTHRFETTIVGPTEIDNAPPAPSNETPSALQIVSAQGGALALLLGAKYEDVQVLATFPSGKRDVTGESQIVVENDSDDTPAIAISAGRLSAENAGAANVYAQFNGVRTEQPLAVTVSADLPLTAILVAPGETDLDVDGSVSLRVIGFIGRGDQRRSVGDVSSRGDVSFESDNRSVAEVQGSVVTGLATGQAIITARLGELSAAGAVNVVLSSDAPPLEISPGLLRLRVGETAWLGDDFTVTRGGADFSNSVEAATADSSIAQFDVTTGALVGVSPGRTSLSVAIGAQSGVMTVEVGADEPMTGSVVIEPAVISLAEGQATDVRVYLVGENGERIDRTTSAVLRVEKEEVLAVSGNRITGLAAGRSRIAALLPEVERPGIAAVTVVAEDYTELIVSPPQMQLNLGGERGFQVFALGPSGRRELGDHPELQVTIGGASISSIELIGPTRVRGVAPGESRINVAWRDLPTRSIAVRVVDETPDRLRMQPTATTIEVDKTTSFSVFVRQGGREHIVTPADGLELRIGNPEVVESLGGLTVRGLAPGRTEVIASLGGLRVVAQINVTPRVAPPPRGKPVRLRFIPDVLQLELGTPAASVRIVRVWSDGTTEDVDNRSDITLDREGVVEQSWTASGPVFQAVAQGRTRAVASIEGLTTGRPLLLDVVLPGSNAQPRLAAYPGRMSISVGETAGLQAVQLIPGRGRTPVSVDYQISSNDPQIVRIQDGRTLRGVAPGWTQLTITPVGVSEQYQSLATTIAVEVVEETVASAASGISLVLTGPSRATVGSTVQFQVELVTDSGSRMVTNEQTTLEVSRGAIDPPTALGGCALRLGEAAERLTIQASHRGILSNVLQLRVEPVAGGFASLEIQIDRTPMTLGERREYRVWGTPLGGGQRQNLTGVLTNDPNDASRPRVVLLANGASPVEHASPVVNAVAAGRFRLRAVRGGLQSAEVVVDVLPADSGGQIFTVAPANIILRVGETSSPILAYTRSVSGGPARRVAANLASVDPTVVAPAAGERFIGQAAGQTEIIVESNGQKAVVGVTVVGSHFLNITLGAPDLGDRSFTIELRVEGTHGSADTKYRVVTAGNRDSTPWRKSQGGKITLESPQIPNGPRGQLYNLTLEARNVGSDEVERRSIPFRLSAQ